MKTIPTAAPHHNHSRCRAVWASTAGGWYSPMLGGPPPACTPNAPAVTMERSARRLRTVVAWSRGIEWTSGCIFPRERPFRRTAKELQKPNAIDSSKTASCTRFPRSNDFKPTVLVPIASTADETTARTSAQAKSQPRMRRCDVLVLTSSDSSRPAPISVSAVVFMLYASRACRLPSHWYPSLLTLQLRTELSFPRRHVSANRGILLYDIVSDTRGCALKIDGETIQVCRILCRQRSFFGNASSNVLNARNRSMERLRTSQAHVGHESGCLDLLG